MLIFSFISLSIFSVIAPGLNTSGMLTLTSIMVDSKPTLESSEAISISIRPFISLYTCSALVGLGLPERLALGAAIGVLQSRINSLASSSSGIRTATVSSPAVVSKGMPSFFLRIKVMGPGQNLSISLLASSETSPTILSSSQKSAI